MKKNNVVVAQSGGPTPVINSSLRGVVEVCRRMLQQSAMHRAPSAVVADATVGVPLLRFITEDMETIPRLLCLRSGQEGTEEMVKRELDGLGLSAQVVYDADVYQTKMALAETRPEMVLGSNIERHAVAELGRRETSFRMQRRRTASSGTRWSAQRER